MFPDGQVKRYRIITPFFLNKFVCGKRTAKRKGKIKLQVENDDIWMAYKVPSLREGCCVVTALPGNTRRALGRL